MMVLDDEGMAILKPIERSDIYLYARARLDTTIVQILYMLEPTQSKYPGLASGCRTDPECRDGVSGRSDVCVASALRNGLLA
jgi:hypothetical protein